MKLLRIEGKTFVVGALAYRTAKGEVAFARMAPLFRKLWLSTGKSPEKFIKYARAKSEWKTDWLS